MGEIRQGERYFAQEEGEGYLGRGEAGLGQPMGVEGEK